MRPSPPARVRMVVASIEPTTQGAAMKDRSGSIRTSIQKQSGSQVLPPESVAGKLLRVSLESQRRRCSAGAWTAGARLEAAITTVALDEAGRAPGVASTGGTRPSWTSGARVAPPALAEPEEAPVSPRGHTPGQEARQGART